MITVRSILSALLLLLGAFGCTPRNYYEGLRQQQEEDCYRLPGADREACRRQSSMNYDEYQRRLREQDERK